MYSVTCAVNLLRSYVWHVWHDIRRLELSAQRRRLTWEATPHSIHEGIQAAISSSDCLEFDTTKAQLFADNGNLGINVTISTCTPPS